MVCIKEACCRRSVDSRRKFFILLKKNGDNFSDNFINFTEIHEAARHSQECGGGTGIFLSVNSSTIIVVRGKRACVWGAVFLDQFGEEDKELK